MSINYMQYKKPIIGMIGVGWIGKHYADDFEERGYKVVRYDITPKYKRNKTKLKACTIVFIAVPTPSTPESFFDDNILVNVVKATSANQIIVIKSTIVIGTTDKLQVMFPDRYILHSPEFLTEKTAKYDVANPSRNIIGYTEKSKKVAGQIMNVLPVASYEAIVPCREAELVKYAGNIWFYFKVMACNLIYDIASMNDLDYDLIKDMMAADKRIGRTHLDVFHQGGRGAGGHCFIKDIVAFRKMYSNIIGDIDNKVCGDHLLRAVEEYNKLLLKKTKKDLQLLKGVYGY